MKKSKYLVRPDDFHIFEFDPFNDTYRSYTLRDITDTQGNRPHSSDAFSYENLTMNFHFFPIEEDELEKYETLESLYIDYISWSMRSDGHGGIKGGTFKEYCKKFNIPI